MKFFKPEFLEDFLKSEGLICPPEGIGGRFANIANVELEREGVRVYLVDATKSGLDITKPSYQRKPYHNAQALLVCIEELPRKECEHEPESGARGITRSPDDRNRYCKHCGVKLKSKAKWEPVV